MGCQHLFRFPVEGCWGRGGQHSVLQQQQYTCEGGQDSLGNGPGRVWWYQQHYQLLAEQYALSAGRGCQHLCQNEGAMKKQANGMQYGGRGQRHLILAIDKGPLYPGPAPQRVDCLERQHRC